MRRALTGLREGKAGVADWAAWLKRHFKALDLDGTLSAQALVQSLDERGIPLPK